MTYNAGVYRRQGGNALVLKTDGRIFDEGGAAADAGHSPLIWSDCPIFQMALNPALGIYCHDDFAIVQTTGFPYKIVGTNGSFLSVVASPYGIARILAAGTDNDECAVSFNNNLAGLIKADAAKDWWFEARVKVSQITLAQGVFVGLAEEAGVANDFHTDDTMVLKVVDYLGFQILAATNIAAIWQTVMALNGGARVALSATAGTAAVAWVKLGMKSVLGTITFYIDGVALATGTTSAATNYPLDQVMCPTFATKCGQGTANSLDIDWWSAAQLR